MAALTVCASDWWRHLQVLDRAAESQHYRSWRYWHITPPVAAQPFWRGNRNATCMSGCYVRGRRRRRRNDFNCMLNLSSMKLPMYGYIARAFFQYSLNPSLLQSRHNFNIVNTAHTVVFSVGVVSGFRIIESELEYYGICGVSVVYVRHNQETIQRINPTTCKPAGPAHSSH
jgi:hypothetical protein